MGRHHQDVGEWRRDVPSCDLRCFVIINGPFVVSSFVTLQRFNVIRRMFPIERNDLAWDPVCYRIGDSERHDVKSPFACPASVEPRTFRQSHHSIGSGPKHHPTYFSRSSKAQCNNNQQPLGMSFERDLLRSIRSCPAAIRRIGDGYCMLRRKQLVHSQCQASAQCKGLLL